MKFLKFNWFTQRSPIEQIMMLFVMVLILVGMVMATLGYKIGYKQGGRHTLKTVQHTTQGEHAQTSEKITQLREQLQVVSKQQDETSLALQEAQQKYETLKTANLQLEQMNDLLLKTVAKDGGIPLKILGAKIVPLAEDIFEYQFDVAKIDKSRISVEMTPRLVLINATHISEIPLTPATYKVEGIAYIRGRFAMPQGFKPKQIKLEIVSGYDRIEQLYHWRVGEVVEIPSEDKGLNQRPVS